MILNQYGDVITSYSKDKTTGKIVIENTQKCDAVLDLNKHSQNEGVRDIEGLGRKVASVPVVLLQAWLDEDGLTWQQFNLMPHKERHAYYRRKINQPEHKFLRASTRPI